jgi:uncharacterized protein
MRGRGAGLAAVLLAAASALGSSAFPADTLPPPPAHYFNDYAGLVSAADAQRLDAKLKAFDEQTSNQVVVAVFPELPSASLEDFTIRTAQSWRAGREKLDNGVVLFVFVKERKARIEVGYGLEGALPDVTASHILQEQLTPRFRAGDYAGGLEAAIDAILAATRGEYKAAPTEPTAMGWALTLLMLLLFGSIFLFVIWIAYKNRKAWATYRGSGWGTGGGWGSGGGGGWTGSSGGGWGGGGGSFGGGGFSGGGGSFGGGGASGRW